MKKSVCALIFIIIFFTLCLTGITFSETADPIRIGGLTGPTSMGMAGILKNSDSNDYIFSICGSADELTPLFIKGELDIISVPVNLGSVLYNKLDGDVSMLCVNTLGVLYILEKGGNSIQSVSDLKGKNILATGKGSTPEFSLSCLLQMNGIDPDRDVHIEYKSEPAEIVAEMESIDNCVCMLPQPYVVAAMNKLDNIRIALDVTEEWGKVSETTLITSGIFCRKSFVEKSPEVLLRFLSDYKESVDYVNDEPEDASAVIGLYGIVAKAVAIKAIPYCHIVYMNGIEMVVCTEAWLNILYNEKPASIGGNLPDKSFYYLA